MSGLIGQVLAGRYRVDEFIGKGAMAEVYKVYDLSRNSVLAIKVLLAELALDRVFLRRFKREAETLARLQHPNIVRFYGLEQEGRTVFIVMDFVDGESLKHKIFDIDGPMPVKQVITVMEPLCKALQYAHNEGYVHADVKPGNIIVDRNGQVMLSDFGISRMTESATLSMVGVGTPAYMAPEQVLHKNPSPQTDVYALGVVLFELLTGDRPFKGENENAVGSTVEKIRWEHLNQEPSPPSSLNHLVTVPLEKIVLKALAKDPVERYQSVLDLLNSLVTVIHPQKEVKRPVPRPQPSPKTKPGQPKFSRIFGKIKPSMLVIFGFLSVVIIALSLTILFPSVLPSFDVSLPRPSPTLSKTRTPRATLDIHTIPTFSLADGDFACMLNIRTTVTESLAIFGIGYDPGDQYYYSPNCLPNSEVSLDCEKIIPLVQPNLVRSTDWLVIPGVNLDHCTSKGGYLYYPGSRVSASATTTFLPTRISPTSILTTIQPQATATKASIATPEERPSPTPTFYSIVPQISYGQSSDSEFIPKKPCCNVRVFGFAGQKGDTVSIYMFGESQVTASLQLQNQSLDIITKGEPYQGLKNQAAIENFNLPYTGVYYISEIVSGNDGFSYIQLVKDE